jgi:ATP-binding cassette subfamily A (ABC1) protein 3
MSTESSKSPFLVYCGDFARQFKALAWKNAKLKLRNSIVLVLELAIPVAIVLLLSAIKGLLKPTDFKAINPAGHAFFGQVSSISEQYDQATCGTQNLVWRCTNGGSRSLGDNCPRPKPENNFNVLPGFQAATAEKCQQVYIAVAPLTADNSGAAAAATDFVTWANTRNTYTSQGVTLAPSFKFFSSEQAIIDVLNSSTYSFSGDMFSSAVVFHAGAPAWDYAVRLNKTYNTVSGSRRTDVTTSSGPLANSVKSSIINPRSGFGNVSPYYLSYVEDGYVPLTNEVNTFIATKTCVDAAAGCTSMTDYFEYEMSQSNPFPSPAYSTNGFWGALGSLFSLLMIVVLLYPLANVISVLVREKEAKLREGMKMMALKSEVLWLSWWFNFIALFAPLSLLLTLVGRKLFEASDNQLVFLYFFVFFLSSTSYAIFMSTFFTNSRTAAIVGSLVFFAGFFIYVGLQGSTDRTTIMIGCLHPATAFTFISLAYVEYEDSGMGVTYYTWNDSENNVITFRDCLNMMFIDAIYLCVLTWYMDNIWPSEYGTHEPWYFVFNPYYWGKRFGLYEPPRALSTSTGVSPENVNVEEVPQNLQAQFEEKKCVDIRNLRKEFITPQGNVKVAVNGLNLTMFQGQITALLGHNGAGKTTAIAMLTGLISPDGGTAEIEGKNILENMHEIRKNLGVCPQHDILFPDLSVTEHLNMFAMFKGVQAKDLQEAVETMIVSVGLTEKRETPARMLSGGQKRKLSVGIAFIGGSRIVFLDEPTSGMDPYSRRFTWNVIRQHREGRVIVLTTHFMDEADLLGDRIAIMGDGKLCCCGSSLYLKTIYGVGYSMTLEKKNANSFDSQAMTTLVKSHVGDAVVLNDVGTEMSFQLPFSASGAFPSLFEQIEKSQEKLGLESYGISVTTLEEVFIKITRSTHTNNTAQNAKLVSKSKEDMLVVSPVPANAANPDLELADKLSLISNVPFEKIPPEEQLLYFVQHVKALLKKRALYFVRDKKAQIFLFLIPFMFLLGGLFIMANTYPSTFEPWKRTSIELYNSKMKTNVLPTPYLNPAAYAFDLERFSFNGDITTLPGGSSTRTSVDISNAQSVLSAIPGGSNFPLRDASNGNNPTTPADMTAYLSANKDDFEAMVVGAYSMTNDAAKSVRFTLASNYTCTYGVPVMQQLMADATVKTLNPGVSISTALYPLPETKRQDDLFSNYNVDLVVTFIMLAVPFVPASFITYVVREKEVKSKHQQMVSGVGVVAYWISTFLWDNISFGITTCMFAFLVAGPFFGDDTTQLGGGGSAYRKELGLFFGLCFLFGMASSGFAYILSYMFKTPANAQIIMIFLCFITGLVLSIVGMVLRILPDTRDVFNAYLRYIFCIFPPFALGDGLHNLALVNLWSGLEQGGKMYDIASWEITGLPIMMLSVETVVYLGLTIAIEYVTSIPTFQQYLDSFHATLPPTDDKLKDEDVLAEEQRIAAGACDENSTILVKNMKKQFYGGFRKEGKYAVKGISLSIPNGQCFGLLGINGAGKTSTLSMLSGEFAPSSGEAFLGGRNLLTDIHTCRRKIGFCPQFDSIFELLTAREHLELYARIKGVKEEFIANVAAAKITEMGLTEYADRFAGTYSGGNKRKLMVAIAMIGEPSIVFLDEPSTGMDPVARRFMWDVISDIVTKRAKCSLILTTHSMEECEALCTRIGIMVGGVLRCLGSAQRLRNKYGNGYQIEIGMVVPSPLAIEEFGKRILATLGIPAATSKSMIPKPGEEDKFVEVEVISDNQLSSADLQQLFASPLGHQDWKARLTPTGNGADLMAALEGTGFVYMKQVASWMILERQFDNIIAFLTSTFGSFTLRERQNTKIRTEVGATNSDGSKRKLSTLFSAVESRRKDLFIQDYSVSQTSLEQIFNFFAAQQEEETGVASGLAVSNDRVTHIGPPIVIAAKENQSEMEMVAVDSKEIRVVNPPLTPKAP